MHIKCMYDLKLDDHYNYFENPRDIHIFGQNVGMESHADLEKYGSWSRIPESAYQRQF